MVVVVVVVLFWVVFAVLCIYVFMYSCIYVFMSVFKGGVTQGCCARCSCRSMPGPACLMFDTIYIRHDFVESSRVELHFLLHGLCWTLALLSSSCWISSCCLRSSTMMLLCSI